MSAFGSSGSGGQYWTWEAPPPPQTQPQQQQQQQPPPQPQQHQHQHQHQHQNQHQHQHQHHQHQHQHHQHQHQHPSTPHQPSPVAAPLPPPNPAASSPMDGTTTTLAALSPEQMRQILASVHQANPDLVNVATAAVVAGGHQQQQVQQGQATMDVEPAPHQQQQQPWNRYQTGHPHDVATGAAAAVTIDPTTGLPAQYDAMGVPQPVVEIAQQPQLPPPPPPPPPQQQQQQQPRPRGRPPNNAGSSITARPSHRHKPVGSAPLGRPPKQQQQQVVMPSNGMAVVSPAQGGGAGRQQAVTTWESRFADLALYKAQKGTCVVSQKDDAALARWVSNQRKQRRLLLEGKTSSLTDERVEMLESIGFEWGGRGRAGGKTGQRRGWDEWLDDLAAWKAEHGDCLVPQKHPSGLGLWVAKQRQNFRLWVSGQPSPMTRERVASLEALGFHFQSVLPPKTPWHERLEELKRYKELHGDCRVRTGKGNEYSQLGKWVDRQRQQYSLRNKGKRSIMTDERLALLEEMGFEWTVPRTGRRPKPRDESQQRKIVEPELGPDGQPIRRGKRPGMTHKEKWDSRYEELKQYKAQYGNTRVPGGKRKDGTYSALGKWTDHQRQIYRRKNLGKKTSMTDERIKLLDDIGFEWILREEVVDGTRSALEAMEKKEKEKKAKAAQGAEDKAGGDKSPDAGSAASIAGKAAILFSSVPTTPPRPGYPYSATKLNKTGHSLGRNLSSAQNQRWLARLEELKQYRQKHGNCRVPAGKVKESTYSALGKWVDHQRQQYRLRTSGKTSTLCDERLDMLEKLGFEFVVMRRIYKGPRMQPLVNAPGGEGKGGVAADASKEEEEEEDPNGEDMEEEDGVTLVYGPTPKKPDPAPKPATEPAPEEVVRERLESREVDKKEDSNSTEEGVGTTAVYETKQEDAPVATMVYEDKKEDVPVATAEYDVRREDVSIATALYENRREEASIAPAAFENRREDGSMSADLEGNN